MNISVSLVAILFFSLFPIAELSAAKRPAYLEAIPTFWSNVYPNGGETLYCGERFGPYSQKVNLEHVFPMSWVTNALKCGDRKQCRRNSALFNQIESDMHNLFPARKDMNLRRGSHPFGMIKGEHWETASCDLEIDRRARRVEPRPAVRGDIARAMLYLHDRYDLKLFKKQKALLKRWHRADPPGKEERRRNDEIERLQGNRNPFIDHPERAKAL